LRTRKRSSNSIPTGCVIFFMVGFEDTVLTRELETFIEQYLPLGVVLFTRNNRDPEQLKTLINDISILTTELGYSKFLFSIDQEGGTVTRFRPPFFFSLPGAMALGMDTSGNMAALAANYTGRQLGFFGIDIDFAPVLDLNSNPYNPQLGLRSFGSQPELTGKIAGRFMDGLLKTGILPTIKHFPGLGDCVFDTHEQLPVIEKSLEELERNELVPFRMLIESEAPLIMTSHVCFPEIDPDFPVTLSPYFLRELLRKSLGFNGIVFTDDLMMGGIQKIMDTPHAALHALQAGVDVCLVCNSIDTAKESINLVNNSILDGKLSQSMIQQKQSRINSMVTQCKRFSETRENTEIPSIEQGRQIASKIAEHAVIQLGDPDLIKFNNPNLKNYLFIQN